MPSLGPNADPLQQLLRGCRRAPSATNGRAAPSNRAHRSSAAAEPLPPPPSEAPATVVLPPELDFFASSSSAAAAAPSAKTARKSKRSAKRRDPDADSSDSDSNDESEDAEQSEEEERDSDSNNSDSDSDNDSDSDDGDGDGGGENGGGGDGGTRHVQLTQQQPSGPDSAFRSLVPHPRLHAALARLKLVSATPVQVRAIAAMRAGHDVVAVAPTGSGKTLAYALPLLLDILSSFPSSSSSSSSSSSFPARANGRASGGTASPRPATPSALVLAPTRELAHQIATVFRRVVEFAHVPLRVVELSSRAAHAGLASAARVDIVIGTPMRVAAAAGAATGAQAAVLRLADVRHVVLDEADELFSDKFLAQLDAVLAATGARQRGGQPDDEAEDEGARKKKGKDKGKKKKKVKGDPDAEEEEEEDAGTNGDGEQQTRRRKRKNRTSEASTAEEEQTEQATDEGNSKKKEPVTIGPRVHMFSATLPAEADEIARRLLPHMKRVVVSGGDFGGAAAVDKVASVISQRFVFVGGRGEQGKVLAVRDLLREGSLRAPALVFVQSKERAAELFRELVYDGVAVDAIHGDRTAAARAAAVARFRAGKVWLLIATDIVARGLDFLAVNSVLNYDVPASASAYVHRIGRTGRNGRSGKAITLFTEEDVKVIAPVVKVAKASGAEIPEWLSRVAAKVRADESKRLQTRPPKRRRIGGPNRASIRGKKRKGRQGESVGDTGADNKVEN